MSRVLGQIIALGFLVLAGSLSLWFYRSQHAEDRKLEAAQAQVARLEEEKKVLTQVVQRLGEEKRVADVVVLDQRRVDGVMHSTLLFVEMDKNGQGLPPKRIQVIGEMAHIDAMVIKFDQEYVARGDALRGHSIVLFTRIYGDRQSPTQGTLLDAPGEIPAIYRGADPKVADFELSLWQDFWKLADDPEYAAKLGVRVANGQSVWGPFDPDKLYTVTLESNGGLNIRPEPLKGIYRELIRSSTPASSAPSPQ